jgi:hypothetical protein
MGLKEARPKLDYRRIQGWRASGKDHSQTRRTNYRQQSQEGSAVFEDRDGATSPEFRVTGIPWSMKKDSIAAYMVRGGAEIRAR